MAMNHLRALGRFIANYWFWMLLLVVLNVAVWLATECFYRPDLQARPGELWSVRMYLASGLLLFDNLCVLWWYAHSTRELVRKAESQQRILEAQLGQAQAEYKESQRQLLVSQKPVVYTERVEDPDHTGRVNYFVRNAGGGPAVNVYYIGLFDLMFGEPISLGALAAGDARLLPTRVNSFLQEGHGGIKYVLLGEAHFTRTTQWTPTLNIRTQTAGRHGGQVLYRTAEPAKQPPRFQFQSLRDCLANNTERFAEQLLAFGKEEAAE